MEKMVRKFLIIVGAVLVVIGVLWPLIAKLGLGRLPGDITFKGDGFTVFLPVTSMILISIAISLIVNFLNK